MSAILKLFLRKSKSGNILQKKHVKIDKFYLGIQILAFYTILALEPS